MVRDLASRALTSIRTAAARLHDEDGQTLAEYGLIVSVIAVAVMIAALFAFKESIVGAFGDATNCLDSASSGSC
jgi:Flp pilus assembly pilin Flp